MLERDVLEAVRVAVCRLPGVSLWRNSVGYDSQKRIRYGLGQGSADLVGIIAPEGRWLALEVKRPRGGRVSAEQKAWLALMTKRGAVVGVVRSAEEAVALVEGARG